MLCRPNAFQFLLWRCHLVCFSDPDIPGRRSTINTSCCAHMIALKFNYILSSHSQVRHSWCLGPASPYVCDGPTAVASHGVPLWEVLGCFWDCPGADVACTKLPSSASTSTTSFTGSQRGRFQRHSGHVLSTKGMYSELWGEGGRSSQLRGMSHWKVAVQL